MKISRNWFYFLGFIAGMTYWIIADYNFLLGIFSIINFGLLAWVLDEVRE